MSSNRTGGSLPTLGSGGHRRWLYPLRRDGSRATLRRRLAIGLIAFYALAPWVSVAGKPLIRFSLADNSIYFLGQVFRLTDTNLLVFVVLGVAFLISFVTALRGRLWCGYACPQTVFLDWLIRPIEEFIEGGAFRRQVADKAPAKPAKWYLRKVLKHAVFLFIASNLAHAFLAFFIDPVVLLSWMRGNPLDHPVSFGAVTMITAAFYLDFAWFREQFCSFLCPYARFQSLLMDSASPAIAYDPKRGEPKGRNDTSGDCIDCKLCMRVCPTGIDIREGLQLECIQCGRCADACDQVMTGINRPTGLIRTASENEIQGIDSPRVRPRPLVYGVVASILLSGFLIHIFTRAPVQLKIVRQTGTTFSTMPDGRIANMFQARFTNNTRTPYRITLTTDSMAEILCPPCGRVMAPYESVVVPFLIVTNRPPAKVSVSFMEQTRTLPFLAP